jgi:hypothetical protein
VDAVATALVVVVAGFVVRLLAVSAFVARRPAAERLARIVGTIRLVSSRPVGTRPVGAMPADVGTASAGTLGVRPPRPRPRSSRSSAARPRPRPLRLRSQPPPGTRRRPGMPHPHRLGQPLPRLPVRRRSSRSRRHRRHRRPGAARSRRWHRRPRRQHRPTRHRRQQWHVHSPAIRPVLERRGRDRRHGRHRRQPHQQRDDQHIATRRAAEGLRAVDPVKAFAHDFERRYEPVVLFRLWHSTPHIVGASGGPEDQRPAISLRLPG